MSPLKRLCILVVGLCAALSALSCDSELFAPEQKPPDPVAQKPAPLPAPPKPAPEPEPPPLEHPIPLWRDGHIVKQVDAVTASAQGYLVLDLGEASDIVDVTVVPLMMLAFVLTERLGAELRNPFSNHSNDVPMRALCRTIEINLRQQLGEKDVPEPLEPVKGVLM